METTMSSPLGVMPWAIFIWVAAIETFTHGWDLAKATGQSTDLDPALAEQLFGAAQQGIPETLRGPTPSPSAQP
jgi:hypothetical protein